jgi:hypothetical protein
VDPSTLEALKAQVSQLKAAGLSRTQIADRLEEAGLNPGDLETVLGVDPDAHAKLEKIQRQAGPIQAVSLEQLVLDIADNLHSLRVFLADVKPRHARALVEMETLEQRCRKAVRTDD